MINKNIIGKQYGYRSSALRSIRNFKRRYFVSIPKGFQFFVNRIDEGCHEIDGVEVGSGTSVLSILKRI